MDKIFIFDTTLRDGEQAPGNSMHSSEKIEMALQLEKLGVDVIEAGFPAASNDDFDSVVSIAEKVSRPTVCALSRCKKDEILLTYNALKTAKKPRIHLFLATSPLHMQYKLHMQENEVLSLIKESVSYAVSLIGEVQFSCEDATRSDKDFLVKAVQTAIDAGATIINLPDTVGYAYPDEIKEMFSYVIARVISAEKVVFSTHNHNDLGLAVANTLAAISAGAKQAEVTVNGIGERAGNAALEEVVMALKIKEQTFEKYTEVVEKRIFGSSQMLSSITGVKIHPTKPLVGKNAFLHESGIHQHGVLENPSTYEIINPVDIGIIQNELVLGKHSGKHAFKEYLDSIDVSVSNDELNILF